MDRVLVHAALADEGALALGAGEVARGEVAHRINMKFAPDLRFRVDTSFEEGSKIDALLRRDPVVRQDIEGAAANGAEVDDDGADETRQG